MKSRLCRYSRDELRVLDAEGRCVVTDHGAFVLFNVYGPAIAGDDKERFAFKLAFYEVRLTGKGVTQQLPCAD